MTTDLDSALETLMRGRLASNALAAIEDVLDTLDARVDRRIMQTLYAGAPLTPDQALQAWFEKFAIQQLHAKLAQLANAGQSAGAQVAPHMSPPQPGANHAS